ncbi:MAG: hypothetical protein OXF25_08190 [Cyanobacteria bacterium MAG CAR3_bin_5]|nr:hypothetical protein [Cyanobacteria bacterium MAG CAR3_bin_5]
MSQSPRSSTQPVINSGNAVGYAVANTNCAMSQRPRSTTQLMTNSGNAVG